MLQNHACIIILSKFNKNPFVRIILGLIGAIFVYIALRDRILPFVTASANTPTLIEISQTQGLAGTLLGESPLYVSVGVGQSFVVEKRAIIREIQIYLEVADKGNAATDQIICDLRNDSMVILGSSSVVGFSSGGGWQSLEFSTQINRGTYIFTCYLLNHYRGEQHSYVIGGNVNDNSYLGGTRYISTGGNPQDGNTWKPSLGDLKFKITMEASY